MKSQDDHRRSAADRVLAVRARGDLQSVETTFAGQASYVVKDPVTGEAFHLSPLEHRLLEALRRPTSLRTLARIVETEFAPQQASVADLQQFVNRLYEQGLLVGDNPGQGGELLARGRQRRLRGRWASMLSVLAIRVGSFPAGPLVDRLYAALRPLFTPWAAGAAVLVVGYAALIVAGNAATIAARLPALAELAQPRWLPLWIAAIAGVKALHELGHALACRHFGARPAELGVLLLAGAPALYCDVSDAWRLPSKWRRMTVSAAGMLVELLIASVAAIVWWHAAPGLVSALCLSLIVVCTVGTLAVNLNPLLRYDGYYLLADWLETPNLAERARGLLAGAWRQWALGGQPSVDPLVGPGKRRALWLYAILSKAYLALVLVAVFSVLVKLAKPRGLENAVYAAAALTVLGLLLGPLVAAVRMAANPSVRARLRWLRLVGSLAVLGGGAAAALAWPVTRRVTAPVVAVPAQAHALYAVADGAVEFAVPEGAWVEPGAEVVRLTNPELELSLAAAESAVRERRLRLAHLRTLQATHAAAARMIPTAAAELADAEAHLAEQQTIVDSLVIRAPAAGRVLAPPPRRAERSGDDTLPTWHGSPLEDRNRGAWIEAGAPLAVVAAPGAWLAWAGVDQADVADVQPGQPARVAADAWPTTILAARVVEVSRRARDNAAASAGAPQRDAATLGDNRYHVVKLSLEAADARLLAAARGTAKIDAHRATVGGILWRWVRQTFTRLF